VKHEGGPTCQEPHAISHDITAIANAIQSIPDGQNKFLPYFFFRCLIEVSQQNVVSCAVCLIYQKDQN